MNVSGGQRESPGICSRPQKKKHLGVSWGHPGGILLLPLGAATRLFVYMYNVEPGLIQVPVIMFIPGDAGGQFWYIFNCKRF